METIAPVSENEEDAATAPAPVSATELRNAMGHFLTGVTIVTARGIDQPYGLCLLYTSPSPRDCDRSRMPSSA